MKWRGLAAAVDSPPPQLVRPVAKSRRGLVALDVGLALVAVEDVVAGDVDDSGAGRRGGGGDITGALDVDRGGRLLRLLGAVDVGPGGAVDDDVGALRCELRPERRRVGDV